MVKIMQNNTDARVVKYEKQHPIDLTGQLSNMMYVCMYSSTKGGKQDDS